MLRSAHNTKASEVLHTLDNASYTILDTAAFKETRQELDKNMEERFRRLEAKNVELWKVHRYTFLIWVISYALCTFVTADMVFVFSVAFWEFTPSYCNPEWAYIDPHQRTSQTPENRIIKIEVFLDNALFIDIIF